jgi:hypothetical protein
MVTLKGGAMDRKFKGSVALTTASQSSGRFCISFHTESLMEFADTFTLERFSISSIGLEYKYLYCEKTMTVS